MASNVIRLSTPDAAVGGNFASNKKTILRCFEDVEALEHAANHA